MGYEDALRKHSIPVDKTLMQVSDTIELAREIVPSMLKIDPVPDAFFCINDEVAAHCLQMIKSAGFKIPEDISVCGFTNSDITEVTDPRLTSVDQHGFEMGRTAAKLLINRIEGKETRVGIVSKVIKTDLVVKNSTK